MTRATYTPGGDAKVIAEIAKQTYGSYAAMFEHHGWPKHGPDVMRKVQTRAAETYGSIKDFKDHQAKDQQS